MEIIPTKGQGVLTWILAGFVGALIALLVGYFIPTLVPQRAAASRL